MRSPLIATSAGCACASRDPSTTVPPRMIRSKSIGLLYTSAPVERPAEYRVRQLGPALRSRRPRLSARGRAGRRTGGSRRPALPRDGRDGAPPDARTGRLVTTKLDQPACSPVRWCIGWTTRYRAALPTTIAAPRMFRDEVGKSPAGVGGGRVPGRDASASAAGARQAQVGYSTETRPWPVHRPRIPAVGQRHYVPAAMRAVGGSCPGTPRRSCQGRDMEQPGHRRFKVADHAGSLQTELVRDGAGCSIRLPLRPLAGIRDRKAPK